MEKINKAIEILQAFREDKTIEFLDVESGKWKKVDNYVQVLNSIDARMEEIRIVKEPTYRPYANAEEFLKASKEHGPYLKDSIVGIDKYHPLQLAVSINNTHITTYCQTRYPYEDVAKRFIWQDGTPCGILE